MPKLDTEDIWFDGVDKKLIETHSIKSNPSINDDKPLLTKTSLAQLSTHKSKRQHEKSNHSEKAIKPTRPKASIQPNTGLTDELALDCEMVECYHHKSVLARVSIVNLFGHPILDRYVAPPSKVTDYRTRYSGIRRKDLVDAPDFETVQKEVTDIIRGRIVVGHAIHNDFEVLKINHPRDKTRDTSEYYRYLFQGKTPSLKKLSESVLGVAIQNGEHDSVQDAQATMKLYVKERDKWNTKLMKSSHSGQGHGRQKKKPKKKKVKTFYVMT